MRLNLPITNHETTLSDEDVLVSMTDKTGKIIYVNPAFMQISGFTKAELLGHPHNLVRHPDVPSTVFEQMWASLATGETWVGCIKNRCKNGGFYWVTAYVSPSKDDHGNITGYISVRTKATASDIAQTEHLFRQLPEN